MKTMKLLPLKITVTSAMIVGLGAASNANAQTSNSGINQIVEEFLPKLTQALNDPQYQHEFEDALDQYHNMVVGNTSFVSTVDVANQTVGNTALKFYSDSENTLPSSMLFDQILTNQRLNGFKEGQPFIPVDDNGNPITQVDDVLESNGQTKKVRSVTTRIATAEDVTKSPYAQGIQKDIDDIYEFNHEVVDNIATLNRATEILTEAGNHHDELIRKNKADIQVSNGKIESLKTLYETTVRTVGNNESNIKTNKDAIAKNKANIKTLAKAQLAGVEVMAELNKNIAGTQTDIANNKITLAQHAKKIDDNQQAIEAKLGGKADLQKLSELKTSVDKNQADIQLHDTKITNLATLFSWTTPTIGNNTKGVATNKADIAENKDDIQNNINNIYELAQQQDQHSSDIKTLAKASSANTDRIAKNKADADASFETLTKNQNALIEKDKAQDTLIAKNKADADTNFETLTKNQNALIEKDKAQDTLIAKNKADADAKFKGVQTDIANNKTTLAQHAKKIDDNQQAIEAKLGGKADAQALTDLNNKVDGFDGRISALDTKVNTFDGRITALDSKVENGMAAQAALSGLFQPYSVGKFNATAALGGYGSKSAVAIGAGYRVNPNLAIKAGAAINTSGDKKGSYNIGVNYEF